jgi:hypothetical protein
MTGIRDRAKIGAIIPLRSLTNVSNKDVIVSGLVIGDPDRHIGGDDNVSYLLKKN